MNQKMFSPHPADSLGLILTYQCNNQCRHCLYACRPLKAVSQPEFGTIKHVIKEIRRAIPACSLHIGGGETFIFPDLLGQTVEALLEHQLILEYVETNGRLLSGEKGKEKLQNLKNKGARCILLSISPFHAEYTSLRDSQSAFDQIVDIFGEQGIFPWHQLFYIYLQSFNPDRPVPWDQYLQTHSLEAVDYQLKNIIYFHPAGRMALLLADLFPVRPAEDFTSKNCRPECSSPVHAHIDDQGNYLAGFCAGLRIGKRTGLDLKGLYEKGINLDEYPILDLVINHDLGALLSFARERGFVPSAGYSSVCHLCLHIRTFLWHNNPNDYQELAPDFFYEEFTQKMLS